MAFHREISLSPTGYFTLHLWPSILFLDDIELIYDTVTRAVGQSWTPTTDATRPTENKDEEKLHPTLDEYVASRVQIRAGDARADTVEDLREAYSEELHFLRISVDEPELTIDLWRFNADISGPENNIRSKELATAIQSFIKTKRSVRAAILGPGWLSVVWLIGFLVPWIGTGIRRTAPLGFLATSYVAAGVATCAFLVFGIFILRQGVVVVRPERRNESMRVSRETQRNVWVGLVGAIAGALVLGVAGLWAGVYTK